MADDDEALGPGGAGGEPDAEDTDPHDEGGSGAEGGVDDLGQPIEELRAFREAPPPGFLGRVVRSLRRRSLGSQLATLSWNGIGQVVLEFLTMIFSLFESSDGDQGETD